MMDDEHVSSDEGRFMQLVMMLQLAAMQQMGKLASPVTNEIERDLPHARASIDMLEMIERKTQGSRTPAETQFIEKVLFELRMNYVDETGRDKAGTAPEEGASGGEDGEAPDAERTDAGESGDPGSTEEP